jgi:hypothetical protein
MALPQKQTFPRVIFPPESSIPDNEEYKEILAAKELAEEASMDSTS